MPFPQTMLDAAGELFAVKGYDATTVEEICGRAGANRAAVSYYFRGKLNCYIEAVKHAHRSLHEQVPHPTWEPGTPPEVRLRDFISTFLQRVVVDREPTWHAPLIMREMFQPTPACAVVVEEIIRPNFRMLLGILGDLLPPEVDEVKRHLIVCSVVGQILHHRVCRPVVTLLVGEDEFRTYDVERLTDHITEFTLAALARYQPTAGQEVPS